jgi:hypothetical protein
MKQYLLFVLAAAACGGDGGTSDGPSDAATSMYTVGGTAKERTGLTSANVGDVTIAVYDRADERMALATTTTDAAGKFTLTYSATKSIEIVLEAKKSGFVTGYFFPADPIGTTGGNFPIDMVTTANHAALYTAANGLAADAAKGTVAVTITSGNSTVGGATLATQPAAAAYLFNNGSGQPSAPATSTAIDGLGFALNVPAGMVTINANKGGIMLKNPRFVVHAGALNQAVITP